MARFADQLTDDERIGLRALFAELRRTKPSGWSVVEGDRELVVRPTERHLGKFGITVIRSRSECAVRFFSRQRNHWIGREYFPFVSTSTAAIFAWMEATVTTEAQWSGKGASQ